MAQVFFSWTGPDKEIAMRLRDRLRNAGVDVWEYTGMVPAGDSIPERVQIEVDRSAASVFCVSDAAADRRWLIEEMALCRNAKRNGTMKAILPVKVGPLSQDSLERIGIASDLFLIDESQEAVREKAYVSLTQAAWSALGAEAPVMVPTVLFAMTRDQYRTIRDTPALLDSLKRMCLAAGMGIHTNLLEELEDRYGDSSDDFAPFFPRRPLVELVHQAERLTNQARRAAGQRPIFVRWCTSEFMKEVPDQDRTIQELWMNRNSLLIADSVSTLNVSIQQKILALPPSRNSARSAVVWVPPYTRHSISLEESLKESTNIPHFLYLFRDWMEASTDADIAFDIGTSATLRLFLKRVFREVIDQGPMPDRLAVMNDPARTVGFRPGNAF